MSEKLRIVCPGCGRVYVEVEASDDAPRTMTERETQLLHAARDGLNALSLASGVGKLNDRCGYPGLMYTNAISRLERALRNYTGEGGGES